jgi:hypothetical protein
MPLGQDSQDATYPKHRESAPLFEWRDGWALELGFTERNLAAFFRRIRPSSSRAP